MLKNRTGKVNVASGNSFTIQPFAGSAGLNDIARGVTVRPDLQILLRGVKRRSNPQAVRSLTARNNILWPHVTEGLPNLKYIFLRPCLMARYDRTFRVMAHKREVGK